jgi:hypothetical protein
MTRSHGRPNNFSPTTLATPTLRMNYGRRQIDYYRAGNSVWLLFEGDHMVGVGKERP